MRSFSFRKQSLWMSGSLSKLSIYIFSFQLTIQNIDKVLLHKHCKEPICCYPIFYSIFDKFSKKKNNKNPKNMFLASLRHLQCFFLCFHFLTCFLSRCWSYSFSKKKNKKNRKIKICKIPIMKRKKLRNQFVF
jgi:hypothetical protein